MNVRFQTLAAKIAFLLAICLSPLSNVSSQESVKPGVDAPSVRLDPASYLSWRDHILPDPSELKWQEIPWLTSFHAGLLKASEMEQPLLLWTMNGHPLGCT